MNIAESWESADKTCFDQAAEYLGSKENVDAFRGYLPEGRPAWMFTSGGLQTGPIERLWGTTGAWCALSMAARFEGQFVDRAECLTFGGKVMAWIKETDNLNQIGNVMWLRMTDLPQEPFWQPLESGEVLWHVIMPMEMVFTTSTEY